MSYAVSICSLRLTTVFDFLEMLFIYSTWTNILARMIYLWNIIYYILKNGNPNVGIGNCVTYSLREILWFYKYYSLIFKILVKKITTPKKNLIELQSSGLFGRYLKIRCYFLFVNMLINISYSYKGHSITTDACNPTQSLSDLDQNFTIKLGLQFNFSYFKMLYFFFIWEITMGGFIYKVKKKLFKSVSPHRCIYLKMYVMYEICLELAHCGWKY